MPRDHRHIAYYEGERFRYKLVIQPAGDAIGPGSWTDHVLPNGVIEVANPDALPHFDYGDIPQGMPDAPSWSFLVHNDRLRGADHLVDLRSYIQQPGYANGGIIYATDTGTRTAYRTFQNRNVWRYYSDLGSGDEPDYLMFEGVQRPSKKFKGKAIPLMGLDEITVEVDHIILSMLETALPADVQKRYRTDYLASPHLFQFDDATLQYRRAYNVAWRDNAINYAHAQATKGGAHHRARYLKLLTLVKCMQRVLNDIYVSYLREQSATMGLQRFRFRSWAEESGGGGTETWDGNPYDMLEFYRQSLLRDSHAGAPLGRDELRIIADISVNQDFPDVAIIGGFLSEHGGAASLFAHKNLKEFFTRFANPAKVTFHHPGVDQLDMWFLPIDDNRDGLTHGLTHRSLRYEDPPEDHKPEIPYEQGAKVVGSVAYAVPVGTGDDHSTGTYVVPESDGAADSGPNIDMLFHNLPLIGDSSKRFYGKYENSDVGIKDVAEPYIVVAQSGYDSLGLYYMEDDATIFENTVPMRVSGRQIDWKYRTALPGVLSFQSGTDMPSVSTDLSSDSDDKELDSGFWRTLRAALRIHQEHTGIHAAMGYAIGTFFGRPTQMLYEIDLPIELALPEYFGHLYKLNALDGTTERGANFLLPEPDDWKSGFDGFPHLIKITYNSSTDMAKCVFFAHR